MRLTWLPDVLRASGVKVVTLPGWKGRGKELSKVEGIVWHHTAQSRKATNTAVENLLTIGRAYLPGPLCQLGLRKDGTWVVVADGRANHNGYGTWGNNSIGIEAYNDGVGEPWPTIQRDSWVWGTAAILKHLGLPSSHMMGHRETNPRRKIDPAGIDLNAERKRIQAILDYRPPTQPPTPAPKPSVPTLRSGARGDAVKWLQFGINKISGRGLVVDGVFGPATDRAVRDLQRWFGLTVDGIVGPKTWGIIYP